MNTFTISNGSGVVIIIILLRGNCGILSGDVSSIVAPPVSSEVVLAFLWMERKLSAHHRKRLTIVTLKADNVI